MHTIRMATKQFQHLCPFLSLKYHHTAPFTKIASGYAFQTQKFDIRNNKQIHFECFSSKSSQTSKNFKVISENTLDKRIIQQIKPDECKKFIFGLVSSYSNFEEQAFPDEDSLIHLFTEFRVSQRCNDFKNVQQYQDYISKSDVFQKFLEVLPSHLNSMTLSDLVDVYGGLILLGIPVTDSLMTQLFCKFSNQGVGLELSGIAKLAAIFRDFSFSQHLHLTLLVPAFKSLLMNLSSPDRKDLINISYIMQLPWIETYPMIMNTYFKIISDALNNNDLHQDVHCMSSILNGVCHCFRHEKAIKGIFKPDIVKICLKLMDILEPYNEKMTHKQFSYTFTRCYRSGVLGVLLQMRPHLYIKVKELSKKHVLSNTCMSVRQKLRLMNTFGDIHGYIDILDIIPDADEYTLENIVNIMQKISSVSLKDKTFFSQMLIITRSRLLELLHADFFFGTNTCVPTKSGFFAFIPYMSMIVGLQEMSSDRFSHFMVDFRPYIAEWLDSSYACINKVFCWICQAAIPILDGDIPQTTVKRMENILISMTDFRIIGGAIYRCRNENMRMKIEEAIMSAVNKKELSALDLTCMMNFYLPKRNINSRLLKRLAVAVNEKWENEENSEEFFLSILTRKKSIVSENMANRVLKYYNSNVILTPLMPHYVFLCLLLSFEKLSCLPKHMKELEQLSKHIFDTYMDKKIEMCFFHCMLYILCSLGIYMDDQIQTCFSIGHLKEFKNAVKELCNKKTILWRLNCFVKLNRHIVLHRKDLGIPWISKDILETIDSLSGERVENRVSCFKMHQINLVLKRILGGSMYYKTNVTIDYGLNIDFEYFVDSHSNPVIYNKAKKMDLTNTGIRKCAIHYERRNPFKYLTNDINALAVRDAEKILDLSTLGYDVVFIPYTATICPLYMREICGLKKNKSYQM